MKTKSEGLFEAFLAYNHLAFEKIQVADTHRPDYRVFAPCGELIFEITELVEDKHFNVDLNTAHPHIRGGSRTVGDHIRRKIRKKNKQLKFGANQGIASVLLVYNSIDPIFQSFGTESTDFIAAMYGDYKICIAENGITINCYNLGNETLTELDNTSCSAVGHLCDRSGQTTVILYENVFAKVRVPYDDLPRCFDVQRIEISSLIDCDNRS